MLTKDFAKKISLYLCGLSLSVSLCACSVLKGDRPDAVQLDRSDRKLKIKDFSSSSSTNAKTNSVDLSKTLAYYKFFFLPENEVSIEEMKRSLTTFEEITQSNTYDIAEAFSAYGGSMIDPELEPVESNHLEAALASIPGYAEALETLKTTCETPSTILFEKVSTGIDLNPLQIGPILLNESNAVLSLFLPAGTEEEKAFKARAIEFVQERDGLIAEIAAKTNDRDAQTVEAKKKQFGEIIQGLEGQLAELKSKYAEVIQKITTMTLADISQGAVSKLRESFTPKIVEEKTGIPLLKMGQQYLGASFCLDGSNLAQSKGFVSDGGKIITNPTFKRTEDGKIGIHYENVVAVKELDRKLESFASTLGEVIFNLGKGDNHVWRKKNYRIASVLAYQPESTSSEDHAQAPESSLNPSSASAATSTPSNIQPSTIVTTPTPTPFQPQPKPTTPVPAPTSSKENDPSTIQEKPRKPSVQEVLPTISTPPTSDGGSQAPPPITTHADQQKNAIQPQETSSGPTLAFQTGAHASWGSEFVDRLMSVKNNFLAKHAVTDVSFMDLDEGKTFSSDEVKQLFPLLSYLGIEFDQQYKSGDFQTTYDRVFAPYDMDTKEKNGSKLRKSTCPEGYTTHGSFQFSILISPNPVADNPKYQDFLFEQLRADQYFAFKEKTAEDWRLDYLDRFSHVGIEGNVTEKINASYCMDPQGGQIYVFSSLPSGHTDSRWDTTISPQNRNQIDRIMLNGKDLVALRFDLYYTLAETKAGSYLRVFSGSDGLLAHSKAMKQQREILNQTLASIGKSELPTNTATRIHAIIWIGIPYQDLVDGINPKVQSIRESIKQEVPQSFINSFELNSNEIQAVKDGSDGLVEAPGNHDSIVLFLTLQ
ncbi:MAG: hypothetical protein R3A11_05650 [Bdellovibrionota bacterium]